MIRTESVFVACLASAAAGAAAIALAFALTLIVPEFQSGDVPARELPHALGNLVIFTGYAFVGAFLVFSTGLLFIGLPAWFLLRRAGRRSRTDAVIAGGVLSVIGPAALALPTQGLADPGSLIICLAVLVAGAIAGWTLHRVAYGRAKPL